MKNFKNFWAGLAVLALMFTSCSKDEEPALPADKASLSFGAVLADLSGNATKQSEGATTKQFDLSELPACSEDQPDYIEIVLLQGETEIVGTTDEPYRVDLVDGQIFTEEDPNLELDPGTYTLDHFAVYNAEGELMWVAPKGGVLSQFVDNSLPMDINIGAGVKKYVDVSVLCYDDRDVNQYGYQFFELDVNEAFEFCFFANYCAPNGRHYPARYSVDIKINGNYIYRDVVNTTGVNEDGDNYADPLCFALPDLPEYAEDEPYIIYEVTLLDWEGVYDAEEMTITGSLSQEEIRAKFQGENALDYEHLRFGCQ